MGSRPTYIDLRVDVFDQCDQRAQVLPDLRPLDVIRAILEEFGGELDYLQARPEAYQLARARTGEVLDAARTVGEQVRDGERLILVELEPPLPPGTSRPSSTIYLYDMAAHGAFRIAWQPAVIGRSDPELVDNDLVAVDLSSHPGGSRVSRRHLKLWEEDATYYIQAASTNPASLIRLDDSEVSVPSGDARLSLAPGDVIRLDRAQIRLRFLVRGAAGVD
jgi:hypothetical protein